MCTIIHFKGKELESIDDFQKAFKVDATKYGFDEEDGDQLADCLCFIELHQFFRDHPELGGKYLKGDWVVG